MTGGAISIGAGVAIRRFVSVICCLAVMLGTNLGSAQQDERAVRAAYVFNLTKYVEWPRPGDELVIGFIGEGSMGTVLQKVVGGKNSDTRLLRVIVLPTDEQLQRCDLVYVAYSSAKKNQQVLEALRGKGILTIGEGDSFARDGGMVGLVRVGDEVHIEINLEAAQSAGLKISSRLLNLASIVRTGAGG